MSPSNQIRTLRRKLLSWYSRNKRNLPWRRTRNPYRIMVSEIMLQQTQVATVIPYYRRFIQAFPTPSSLGRAPLQKVLKLWEGLGYYRRATYLHRAAQEIQGNWKGKLPSGLNELSSLPGIGQYTAGAIASIAFGKPAPVVDGNVKRVICRLFAIREDPKSPAVHNQLWKIAGDLLPKKNPGDFNQALMEFGAMVCTPRNPSCPDCPVRENCAAYRMKIQDSLPLRTPARAIPKTRIRVAVIQCSRGILISPRPDNGLLAGLWGFPEFEWKKNQGDLFYRKGLKSDFKVTAESGIPLDPVVHTYSHRQITYYPFLFQTTMENPPEPWRWIPIEKTSSYPFPNAMRKILEQTLKRYELPMAAEECARYPA